VTYETTLVDLKNKSPEFTSLYAQANPIPDARAKVPLLQIGDSTLIVESLIVSEYVAETYQSSLLPTSPESRATVRLFTELCGSTFSYFSLLRSDKGTDFDTTLQTFREGLVHANAFLVQKGSQKGPFLSEDFWLAECNIAPSVQRCCTILPEFTGKNGTPLVDPLAICDELDLSRLKQWIEAVLSRPSVIKTGVSQKVMIKNTGSMLERMAAMSKK